MQGLMMDYPLTIQHILSRATRYFPQREIVTRTANGIHRYTYADLGERAARLASALRERGIRPGDRVASFGWNTYRHLEMYLAIPSMGAVLHMLNVRLFTEQIEYIINHAEDKVIIIDADLVPLLEKLDGKMPTVERFIIMDTPAAPPRLDPVEDYEAVLASASPEFDWPQVDENDAAGMCYTSGTTGNPKGVVYSHRSTLLHSFGLLMADNVGLSERDVVMPVVPMFHANAWGFPYAATLAGAKQVMPGRFLAAGDLAELIEQERVTVAAGVPSIWIGLASYLERLSLEPRSPDLSSLRAVPCGGSAIPPALMRSMDKFGIHMIHAWGMTETSPLASVSHVHPEDDHASEETKLAIRTKQGLPVPGVEARVVDLATGQEVPWDGSSVGEIQVRGPWVARSYYRSPESDDKFAGGWLHTGDVATVDAKGYMQIVDRTKDLVKSGGEWISSVELENHIMAYPKVLEAAVIGVPHPVLQERPVAYVVPKPEFKDDITGEEIIDFLRSRVAKWWLPDDVIFIEAVPKTSVGKFSKRELRDVYAKTHATAPTQA